MNLQKVREQEIRDEALDLLMRIVDAHCLKKQPRDIHFGARGPSGDPSYKHWLRLAGPISGRRSPKLAPELRAVAAILRAHVLGQEFDDSDVAAVQSALNSWVSKLWFSRAGAGTIGERYLVAEGPRLRFVAEALLRYLQHAAEFGSRQQIPFGICPGCDGLFLKMKASQKTCGPKCRFESWRARVGSNYWKDRHAKPARRAVAAGLLPEKQMPPKKTGVDLGVELPPKATKKHGKPRKG